MARVRPWLVATRSDVMRALVPILSLGIAWLVIVAVEMLTGSPGIGGFLWQEYNSLIYEHIILCILTIGIVGFVLDRLMSVVERRLQAA